MVIEGRRQRLAWAIPFVLLILAFSQGAHATENFAGTIWHSRDGLPENTVLAVVQDWQGFLWVGTTGGLSRFDGASFAPLPVSKNSSAVSSFYCLLRARDGSIWAGTEGEGLVHFLPSGGLRTYGAADGLSDSFVRAVFEDSSERLWVGTDRGLFLKQEDRFVRVEQPRSGNATDVYGITEDSEHQIIAGGTHLIVLGRGQSREIQLPGAYSQNQVKCIVAATDGTLWIGTATGLLHGTLGHLQPVREIASPVPALHQSSDGTIWIGTAGRGLWTYSQGNLARFDDKLSLTTVLNIFEDTEHRIWIGSRNGLLRLQRSQVNLIPLPICGSELGTISGSGTGTVWMADQRVFRVSETGATPLSLPGLKDNAVRNVYRSRDGSIWVGTGGRGAYHIDHGTVTHYTEASPQPITSDFIRGFFESSSGEIWIATGFGLNRITNKGVARYGIADGLPSFNIRCLTETRDRKIWIGTDQGLGLWHNGAFETNQATTALRGQKVWTIFEDRKGTMWFGTRDHGLFRYRGNKVDHYSTADGLLSNIVYQLLQDKTGRFWIASAESIASIPELDLEANAPQPNQLLRVTAYSMPSVAEGVRLSGGQLSTMYLAPDDTLWFASIQGALHIIPGQAEDNSIPQVRLAGWSLDGVDTSLLPNTRIPASVARLTISFASLYLSSRIGIRSVYRLDGFDKDWVSTGPDGSATYTNLPAGTYRFRVRSFNVSQPDRFTEQAFTFTKKQFFYLTWWFESLCGLMLLGCGMAAYALRLRAVRERFVAVLEERARLARELHDTVIQGCTGVSFLLEAMASTREHGGRDDDVLDVARSQIQQTIVTARAVVSSLRHEHDQMNLSQTFAELANQAAPALGIPVVWEQNCKLGPIPFAKGSELLMAAREAIANAGYHANPTCIRICALVNGDHLEIRIVDDGRGFILNPIASLQSGHYGLQGMRERMERIGGTLHVTSVPGQGTEVQLRIPLKQLSRTGTVAEEIEALHW